MKSINYHTWSKMLGFLTALLIMLVTFADVNAAQQHSLKPKQVKSFKQLKQLLSAKRIHRNDYLMMRPMATVDAAAMYTASAAETGAIEHSETNVQVAGVDEGDSVKTDGQYIYRIENGQVRIILAYPADAMDSVALLPSTNNFSPIELYLQGDQLIVIGSGWHTDDDSGNVPVIQKNRMMMLPIWAASGESRTMARVYDITDRTKPVLQREVEFSGSYLSSRKIDDSVYVIGRKYPNYFMGYWGGDYKNVKNQNMTPANLLPHFSDSVVGKGKDRTLPLNDLYYFPGFVEPDYVVVAGFRLNAMNEEANIKAYLGSGDITYASSKNLYLSAADYNSNDTAEQVVSSQVTRLYKYSLDNGDINFSKAGEVPGTVLNSFSMDEHDGYFRIATTVDQWIQTGDTGTSETWNNLYTIDSDMNIAGRLEHLAEGERIYSARFIGDRCYLVTFRQVDPLFVIDLSEPALPKKLGELKIPGFSNYLHPYDENHILGFGQDTEETSSGGVVTNGMKLALFDVTDVNNPTEMHKLIIGKQGTYSSLMSDHKALLFDKKRGLLGFPVSVTAKKPGENWPSQVFQGAHIYKITLKDGFQKQAAITHQENGDVYDWSRHIQRLLTIGNQLYTFSETRVQANDLVEYKQTNALDFPIDENPGCVLPETDVATASYIPEDCMVVIDPPIRVLPLID